MEELSTTSKLFKPHYSNIKGKFLQKALRASEITAYKLQVDILAKSVY